MAVTVALLLAGCGGGGGGGSSAFFATAAPEASVAAPAPTAPAPAPVEVDAIDVAAVRAGVSPFIAFVDLKLSNIEALAAVRWRIEPKPGSATKPVDVRYTKAYLERRGYSASVDGRLTIPVFGLYANHANDVAVEVERNDHTVRALRTQVVTAAYVDPSGIYDRPRILKPRAAGEALGFDFFYMRSALGYPVVVDSDGQMRWAVPGTKSSSSSFFHGNGFVIGDSAAPTMRRLEFDGTVREFALPLPDTTNFHHTIDTGKQGVLVELDANINGVAIIESILADVDPDSGTVFKQWDLADTFSRHMQNAGEDSTAFVRPGTDWFHMNAATYDPRDDSLIVSSRENFVVKIDYASGDLRWILGDPSKYWHGFPSLAASSLTLAAGALYPIGQHAVSITHGGDLLLFNNGLASLNQPVGVPVGDNRSYSAVLAYTIDAASQSASEVWRFDYGQTILSDICSSAYEAGADTSILVSYAVADQRTHARLVALDESRRVVFDFEYATSGCSTSWNAKPIDLGALRFE
ncbi:aryl-sulfate sulfotransferase [Variovorax saccharolyticus]|uniref:aryl-sulfate sulfotransferase n=1 Tax=Variovorax saccharolyticus TaxID=3053516 RepID=UPI00257603E1|nr:aryl-sulfate sulfotransferase [Variovorax sp. J22R187]MDM0018403.1 aryl-sulfate sulfotransferase [Variovorax sp. J22R187]